MSGNSGRDLLAGAYESGAKLQTRIDIYEYQRPRLDRPSSRFGIDDAGILRRHFRSVELDRLRDEIASHGRFTVTTDSGVLICR